MGTPIVPKNTGIVPPSRPVATAPLQRPRPAAPGQQTRIAARQMGRGAGPAMYAEGGKVKGKAKMCAEGGAVKPKAGVKTKR